VTLNGLSNCIVEVESMTFSRVAGKTTGLSGIRALTLIAGQSTGSFSTEGDAMSKAVSDVAFNELDSPGTRRVLLPATYAFGSAVLILWTSLGAHTLEMNDALKTRHLLPIAPTYEQDYVFNIEQAVMAAGSSGTSFVRLEVRNTVPGHKFTGWKSRIITTRTRHS
jgi:hypothetical protein